MRDLLEHAAATWPSQVALVAGTTRLTYAELDTQANALARHFVDRGLQRGDRVLVLADNLVETVVALQACFKAGCVPAPISVLTREDKLVHALTDSGAKALVTEGRLTPAWTAALARVPALHSVVVIGPIDAARTQGLPVHAYAELVSASGPAPARRGIDEDLALVIYTSGTTGEPKGVMLSHRNVLAATAGIAEYLELTKDDVILGALPMAFSYGCFQPLQAFQVGARLVLEKGFTYPTKVLETVVREGVTGFPAVPTVYALLAELKNLGDFDLSKVRYCTNAAAALSPTLVAKMPVLFPKARFFSMYGQTECVRTSWLPPERLADKPGSVGVALPNTEFWVENEAGEPLPANEVGQLMVRGATVMMGYWQRPDATAEKLGPRRVLRTGDLCRIDAEGFLTVVGRMDDILKVKGEKVAPKEVEHALMAAPGVVEAAVIGVSDELLGTALKAFVVLRDGVALDEKALQKECAKRLESYMVPKHIVAIPELPKTASGKLKKSDLS